MMGVALVAAGGVLLAGLVLRSACGRWAWRDRTRWAVAVTPLVTTLLMVGAVWNQPWVTTRVEESRVAVDGSPPARPASVRTVSAREALGGAGVALLGLPVVLAGLPLTGGVRPWPRTALRGAALVFTAVSAVGMLSLGALLLPITVAAWFPVLVAPRDG